MKSFFIMYFLKGEIKEEAYCDNPDIILIGNKVDVIQRAITTDQGQNLSKNMG